MLSFSIPGAFTYTFTFCVVVVVVVWQGFPHSLGLVRSGVP